VQASENLFQLLKRARAALKEAGIETARLDAEVLLAEALGVERLQLLLATDTEPPARALATFDALLQRRLMREPMAYILGHREFWSLDFKVTKDTLIPRPDSETLIRAALEWLDRKGISRASPVKILDLGTGTGCLLLTLLHELPNAWGLGVDRSLGAIQVAHENAASLGLGNRVNFLQSDWTGAIGEGALFDIIVSNPPYIPRVEIETLGPEVQRFEPLSALQGGVDGLAAYQALAPQIFRHLARGGAVFLEIGAGQERQVSEIMTSAGLKIGLFHKDFGGITRCLEGEVNKKSAKS
jgi:release factor glutamine methyltransferase